jgi:hypothetical protein
MTYGNVSPSSGAKPVPNLYKRDDGGPTDCVKRAIWLAASLSTLRNPKQQWSFR